VSETKVVFVPTGVERVPENDEWFWCPVHMMVERQTPSNRYPHAAEIYEVIEVPAL
jgi:hypothetical protein